MGRSCAFCDQKQPATDAEPECSLNPDDPLLCWIILCTSRASAGHLWPISGHTWAQACSFRAAIFFSPALWQVPCRGGCTVPEGPGEGAVGDALGRMPLCPRGTPESGCPRAERSRQGVFQTSFPSCPTVQQSVPGSPGGRGMKGYRAEPNRIDVQSDDSRQPPPPRTLCVGRRAAGVCPAMRCWMAR
jgi:hypothetical protein